MSNKEKAKIVEAMADAIASTEIDAFGEYAEAAYAVALRLLIEEAVDAVKQVQPKDHLPAGDLYLWKREQRAFIRAIRALRETMANG